MSHLADLQKSCTEVLLDPSTRGSGASRDAGLHEYERHFPGDRSDVAANLMSALAARFPVVQRLVGEEFFRRMARIYVRREPPRTPALRHFGATFPAFIDSFEPTGALDYLGDMARLELARARAYHAADAEPIGPDAFAALSADQVGQTRVLLHPSVSVVKSRHPIVSIWEAHRNPDSIVPVQCWNAETALVARPFRSVDIWRLPPGGSELMIGLAKNLTIAEAADMARSAAPQDFDLVAHLAVLVGANIVVGFADNVVALGSN
jgi:hypothetical protein